MSPLTPASVVITREIWRPCRAVNNRINLPVFDHHCHLCFWWWNVPMLSYEGDVFFPSVTGYKERCRWTAMGKRGASVVIAQVPMRSQRCLKGRFNDAKGWQGTAGEEEDSSDTMDCMLTVRDSSGVQCPLLSCLSIPYGTHFEFVSALFKHLALFIPTACVSQWIEILIYLWMFSFNYCNEFILAMTSCSHTCGRWQICAMSGWPHGSLQVNIWD